MNPNKQFLPHVSGKYGAPMGRREFHTDWDELEPRSIHLFAVRLDSGGYDCGGAYWGLRRRGERLYCATDGADYRKFIDAESRAAAAVKLGFAHRPHRMEFLKRPMKVTP